MVGDKIVGFDIEVIRAVAIELERELVIKNLDFTGLLNSLLNNNVDIVIAGLSKTDERASKVEFSESYTSGKIAALHKGQSQIASVNDLLGKVIGVQFGTTWENMIRSLASKHDNVIIRSLSNNITLVEELRSGSVDVVIMEDTQVKNFVNRYPELRFIVFDEQNYEFAIAAPKGSSVLLDINRALLKLNSTGKLERLKSQWLGADSNDK
jgi:polar amino acid transport system substrate-binding protein